MNLRTHRTRSSIRSAACGTFSVSTVYFTKPPVLVGTAHHSVSFDIINTGVYQRRICACPIGFTSNHALSATVVKFNDRNVINCCCDHPTYVQSRWNVFKFHPQTYHMYSRIMEQRTGLQGPIYFRSPNFVRHTVCIIYK